MTFFADKMVRGKKWFNMYHAETFFLEDDNNWMVVVVGLGANKQRLGGGSEIGLLPVSLNSCLKNLLAPPQRGSQVHKLVGLYRSDDLRIYCFDHLTHPVASKPKPLVCSSPKKCIRLNLSFNNLSFSCAVILL